MRQYTLCIYNKLNNLELIIATLGGVIIGFEQSTRCDISTCLMENFHYAMYLITGTLPPNTDRDQIVFVFKIMVMLYHTTFSAKYNIKKILPETDQT